MKKKYSPKKPYITPKEVQFDPNIDLFENEGRLHRGEQLTGFPQMPEVSIEKLKIQITEDGQVLIPRYEKTSRGTLEEKEKSHVKDSQAAVRQTWHQLESISGESEKIDIVYRHIQGVHETIVDSWSEFNPNQKKAVIGFLGDIQNILKPKRGVLRNQDKITSIKRLEKAAELLKKGNDSAACASLIGGANDLIARKNTLLREKPFIERRQKSLAIHKRKDDEHLFQIVDLLTDIDQDLRKDDKNSADLGGKFEEAVRKSRKRKEKKFKQTTTLLLKAREDFNNGDEVASIKKVRLSRKKIVEHGSQSTILSRERLEWVRRHPDKELKTQIVDNQAKYFGENMQYWLTKANTQQVENMQEYLKTLGRILEKTGETKLIEKLETARIQFQEKDYPKAEQTLKQ